ncbi:hypothetical protein ACSBR1_020586 [Camellia fascicularis]
MVAYNNKKCYIDIIETKPSNAISIIETDCEVDFAPPLDYKEPEKLVATFLKQNNFCSCKQETPAETEPKFNPFTGSGRRSDGKPLNYQYPSVSFSSSESKDKRANVANGGGQRSSAGSTSQGTARETQGKLVFGKNVNRTKDPQKEAAKEPKQEQPPKKEPKFLLFTGATLLSTCKPFEYVISSHIDMGAYY